MNFTFTNDDEIDDGNVNFTITLNSTSDHNRFDGIEKVINLTRIGDDDTAGFTIVETESKTTTTEDGSTDSFTVELTSQPTQPPGLR